MKEREREREREILYDFKIMSLSFSLQVAETIAAARLEHRRRAAQVDEENV